MPSQSDAMTATELCRGIVIRATAAYPHCQPVGYNVAPRSGVEFAGHSLVIGAIHPHMRRRDGCSLGAQRGNNPTPIPIIGLVNS